MEMDSAPETHRRTQTAIHPGSKMMLGYGWLHDLVYQWVTVRCSEPGDRRLPRTRQVVWIATMIVAINQKENNNDDGNDVRLSLLLEDWSALMPMDVKYKMLKKREVKLTG